jgi:hypothetical protein
MPESLDMQIARWHFRENETEVLGELRLMTAADDFTVVAPFEIRQSARQCVPFVFNSPHSGCYYPARFLSMVRLDANAIRRSEDCHVDELFAGAVALGAPLMAAHFPRSYLDVTREPWELDPRMFLEPVPSFANIRSARVAEVPNRSPMMKSGRTPVSPMRTLAGMEWQSIRIAWPNCIWVRVTSCFSAA